MKRFVAVTLAAALIALLAPGLPAVPQVNDPSCVFGPVPPPATCATASWPVPGADAVAQRYVDRGVAMMYGFNGGEARASFAKAIAHEASLGRPFAFGWWGIAESYTIDINLPWTAATEQPGGDAATRARLALAAQPGAGAEVRDLVNAVQLRYQNGVCKAELNAYGHALQTTAMRHQMSANYLVVAGFSLLTKDNANNPDPAQQSACPPPAALRAGEPSLNEEIDHSDSSTPSYPIVLVYMRLARARQPWNLGLHHLSIHENEYASNTTFPDRWRLAKGDADALAAYGYPDGLSHLPHMAGHIFARSGEYDRTIATNTVALDNDHRYYRDGDGDGQHYLNRYHTHDLDFVLYSLTTLGLNDAARAAIRGDFRPTHMPSGGRPIEQYPNGRPLLSVLLRLHDTKSLPSPHPDDAIRQPWRAQLASLGAARQGNAALAIEIADRSSAALHDATLSFLVRAQLTKVGSRPPVSPPYACTGVLDCYAKAYRLNAAAYNGDPKDYWMVPVGEGYAAALLDAKQYQRALEIFSRESGRFANDPHLEWGAWQACISLSGACTSHCVPHVQCKDAAAWLEAYKRHWRGTVDLTLGDLG
jgi:tetratricopeptide (TPR) repeat protein